jgi:DNA excision repair protein ERCC-8
MAPGKRASHALIAATETLSDEVRLLDLNSGAAVQSLVGSKEGFGGGRGRGMWAVGWSPKDEFLIACGGDDGTVKLWDIRMTMGCLLSFDMDNGPGGRANLRKRAHDGKAARHYFCHSKMLNRKQGQLTGFLGVRMGHH